MYNSTQYDNFLYGIVTTAAPAVGTQLAIVTPWQRQSELQLINFTFTTGADAGNRFIYIEHERGGVTPTIATPDFAQAASLSYEYVGGKMLAPNLAVPLKRIVFSLPEYPFVRGDELLNIRVEGIQVTDQISITWSLWRSWIIYY